jgi:hypothetical protein
MNDFLGLGGDFLPNAADDSSTTIASPSGGTNSIVLEKLVSDAGSVSAKVLSEEVLV